MAAESSSRTESDLSEFRSPHLAVDLVLASVEDDCLKVLLIRRKDEPFSGKLVLPGGFVHPGENLDQAALRILERKAGLKGVTVEQLYTFSEPDRDPRGWVVTAAYLALVSAAKLRRAVDEREGLFLGTISPVADGAKAKHKKQGLRPFIRVELGDSKAQIGFDHEQILATALERMRGKLNWSMIAFDLLPNSFTLFELQRVHEIILGRSVNKPHFRTKMLGRTFPDGRKLIATGKFARTGRHRPAELYRLG